MRHLIRQKPLLALLGVLLLASLGEACSRVLWNDSGRNVLVGRNMDWFEDMRSNLWVLPRGMKRDGKTQANPLTWTSRYGSAVLTAYDLTTVDGINERGLAVHALYLPETKVGKRDPSIPGLSVSLWVQYYLDQFATVSEAVKAIQLEPYQLRMATDPNSGKAGTIHLALNDPTGDSAILECLEGKLVVYHGRQYTIMTNQPTYDRQLENLKQYRGFGGEKRLPGTHEPADRFVRAAYYRANLPKPKSDREAVAAMMSVMRNVSAPFGIADAERPNVSTTIWRTVTDLNRRILYYDSVMSPQILWLDLAKVDFAPGTSVRKLTLAGEYDHLGEISAQLQPAKMFPFVPASEP
ncbi:linear amide C-N hydrolase [Tuwongella immobilis]|uniref:Choloylglycine hydrolase/NAAA C-terminal domain-containing protein n=1 Tax=Tuwongella immobilis TaxID=692036 RepID=A0A6C2YKI8_9BACT|nr:linear amide C-N hydrolase [Tuwongella immobilis]VIP01625.1 choloylglycine hydrolase : Choloylglycine hydrolase OS=Bdellovibrio bacteriovorus W GN=BDW_10425 PE=4 SV=1: CBAH [Tuwongella immobilis]VTR98963.1 choloylglycine hydrolase : Choloylglycine hydrolase OS=Bdellovibrio bacteriovorus W GN=BDW_10425 PE=4 SV=1: CBAH [Tuwongella immobilis]